MPQAKKIIHRQRLLAIFAGNYEYFGHASLFTAFNVNALHLPSAALRLIVFYAAVGSRVVAHATSCRRFRVISRILGGRLDRETGNLQRQRIGSVGQYDRLYPQN
jgi:hypothetical protein